MNAHGLVGAGVGHQSKHCRRTALTQRTAGRPAQRQAIKLEPVGMNAAGL